MRRYCQLMIVILGCGNAAYAGKIFMSNPREECDVVRKECELVRHMTTDLSLQEVSREERAVRVRTKANMLLCRVEVIQQYKDQNAGSGISDDELKVLRKKLAAYASFRG